MAFEYLGNMLQKTVQTTSTVDVRGRVEQVVGTIIRAVVPGVKVGELCILQNPWEDFELKAEVVGFLKNVALLSPLGSCQGVSPATEVIPTGEILSVPVGPELLGRVLDGLGQPLDGGPELRCRTHYPIYAPAPNPMTRRVIDHPISLGLRCIDGVLTMGEGQRMGIFAAAGGGKSTLLSSIIKGCSADVCVLSLIGERGREVREFIEKDIGVEGRQKAVLIVSTSDRSSMERLKAAYTSTAIAEYFRDQGKKVLLLMDSVTRFARAQREIGLAAGEPPTRRGFPPSVFSELPKLMERAGNNDKGSISALYTVLVEGDDMTEPVADETRSILDGHIVLSRKLAAKGHYPAIDVQQSVSRVMNAIAGKDHKGDAKKLRQILAKYDSVELLVQIGEFKKGADPEADNALAHIDKVNAFLKQGLGEKSTFEETLAALKKAVSSGGGHARGLSAGVAAER
ncbi:MAG: type III secretion system ATPase SctN, partial [Duodenibacillus sp.]|nr:type III secretion system ATPase SctN [Duodenibacillus sp.]